QALWDLVRGGLVTNDTLGPLRALAPAGRRPVRARPAPRWRAGTRRRAGYHGGLGARSGGQEALWGTALVRGPTVAGRWSSLPPAEPDTTVRAKALLEVMVERHGILTRGSVTAERFPGGFAAAYTVLSAMERVGAVRRGYVVEGLGPAQFAVPGAVDRLREETGRAQGPLPNADPRRAVVLAAADPANPYGAALPWPGPLPGPMSGTLSGPPSAPLSGDGDGELGADEDGGRPGRPGRLPDALVVLVDGALVLYTSRVGAALTWSRDPQELREAAEALADSVRRRGVESLTLRSADGRDLLDRGHPLGGALESAGFRPTPQGLRLRA
ncbi:MAG: ATP-dependent helicase Lhr and Lhr-like helicase, partial [Actinomycetota bacterium]|nr:ATP-dependent helicase Lhr and Lhr-like helicase [Actinomycetota bacterium]